MSEQDKKYIVYWKNQNTGQKGKGSKISLQLASWKVEKANREHDFIHHWYKEAK